MAPSLNRDSHCAVVDVVDSTGRMAPADIRWLGEQLSRAAGVLKAIGEVRCRVVGDAEMVSLHAKYSNDPSTTDVLTFDMTDGGAAAAATAGRQVVLDVDVVMCLDEAERQGTSRGHSAAQELLLYGVHGVMHCLGHDDHDNSAFVRMHAAEDEVLAAIGVGATFGRLSGMGRSELLSGEEPAAGGVMP